MRQIIDARRLPQKIQKKAHQEADRPSGPDGDLDGRQQRIPITIYEKTRQYKNEGSMTGQIVSDHTVAQIVDNGIIGKEKGQEQRTV